MDSSSSIHPSIHPEYHNLQNERSERMHRRGCNTITPLSRRVFLTWLGTAFSFVLALNHVRLLLLVSHSTDNDDAPRDEELLLVVPPPKLHHSFAFSTTRVTTANNNNNNNNNNTADDAGLSILDGMLQGNFPVLHVRDEEDIPPGRSTWGEIRRIHWKKKPPQQQAPPPPQNNNMTWVQDIQHLAYIAILKNGLTTMGIAFDRLSDKLGGLNATPWVPKRHIDKYLQEELLPTWKTTNNHNHTGVLLFTILRDPVDRFLSGTCQDFYMNKKHPCTRTSPSFQATMQCLMNHLQEGRFSHHQQSQHAILYSTIGSYKDLAVTVLPFGIQNQLLQEMGIYDDNNHNHSNRIVERNRQTYTHKNPRVAEFCQTKPHQLNAKYLNVICKVYQKDVEMVQRTGQRVELCQGRD